MVKIEGLQGVQDALRKMGAKEALKLQRRAVASAAGIIRKAARQAAPVKTGALQKSIVARRVRDSAKQHTVQYEVGVSTKSIVKYKNDSRNALREEQGPMPQRFGSKGQVLKPGKLLRRAEEYEDYGDLFYFRFYELGSVKQSPRPFVGPAFNANKERAVQKMVEVLREGLPK